MLTSASFSMGEINGINDQVVTIDQAQQMPE
jgi:hypothetical protein